MQYLLITIPFDRCPWICGAGWRAMAVWLWTWSQACGDSRRRWWLPDRIHTWTYPWTPVFVSPTFPDPIFWWDLWPGLSKGTLAPWISPQKGPLIVQCD